MIPRGQRKWFALGVSGTLAFMLLVCSFVRSCELRSLGHVNTVASFNELRALCAEIRRMRDAAAHPR